MSIQHDKLITDTIGIDVVLSVLESGHSVELPATGYSMYPSLKPGDRMVVNPLPVGALPMKGSVVVCVEGEGQRAEGRGRKAEGVRRRAEGAGRRMKSSGLRAQGEERSVLVMHRLVEIKKDDSEKILFITRGDSISEKDLPWRQDQIIGAVESFTRNGRRCLVKKRIPLEMEYKINRWMLWIRNKTVAWSC